MGESLYYSFKGHKSMEATNLIFKSTSQMEEKNYIMFINEKAASCFI